MSDRIVKSRASLRPDPDDSSQELVVIESNQRVALLRELATWAKISFVDGAGAPYIGWIRSELLAEAKLSDIKLHDEPFGQMRIVRGEIVAEIG